MVGQKDAAAKQGKRDTPYLPELVSRTYTPLSRHVTTPRMLVYLQ